MGPKAPALLVRKTLMLASSAALAAGVLTGLSLLAASPADAVAFLPAGANVVGTCVAPGAGGAQFTGTQPIAAAVAATGSGGTVYICHGTWADNVTVTVPMTIEGAGQGSTIVEPFLSSPNGYDNSTNQFTSTVFLVQADNVTIQDLTIDGANPGAVTSPSPLTAGATCDTTFAAYGEDGGCDGVTFNAGAGIDTGIPTSAPTAITGMSVLDVTVENVYNVGISDRSYNGSFNFSNDTITNVGGYFSDGIFSYESNGTISNDSVSWAGTGIQSNWGALSVTGNTVQDSNTGIFMGNIGEPAGFAAGGSTTVADNAVSSCWGQSFFAGASGGDSELGIAFFAPFAPTAETASGNTITGCDTGLADFASNNDASYTTPVVTFSDNHVDGLNAYGGIGALVSTDKLGYNNGPVDAQFTDNSITHYPTALYTDETNLDNWAGTNDPALPNGLTVTASGNQFEGAWFNDATGPVSATGNWWGSTTGPTVTIGAPDSESSAALVARGAPTWWTTPDGLPSAPLGVVAARGNRTVTVSWSAPTYTGDSDPTVTVTGYTVTASPGGKTCATAGLSCKVTGLTNGTSYSFTVKATTGAGTGPASAADSAIPSTTATAPQDVSAQPGSQLATVSWSAPTSNGGGPIESYTATASPGGQTCSTITTSCTVTGLTNGTSYTFTVKATNAAGTGPASKPSAAQVPAILATVSPFKYDSSKLTSSMKSKIRSIARMVKDDGITSVHLVGFTNPGESGANGQRLGLNRAVAVAGYLAKVLRSDSANTGVALTESYGGSVRVSKTGSAANRRVLVSLV